MSFHPPGIHQFEPEGVDEGLQHGVAFYHLCENHLRRVLHQQEVGDVQSLTALFIGRDPFQQVGTCGTPAYGFQQRQPSPPFFRCLKVGEKNHLPSVQCLHRFAIEAPVYPSGFPTVVVVAGHLALEADDMLLCPLRAVKLLQEQHHNNRLIPLLSENG